MKDKPVQALPSFKPGSLSSQITPKRPSWLYESSLITPESTEPQRPNAGSNGGRSSINESRKAHTIEHYRLQQDDLGKEATGMPESGTREFLDHWQRSWKSSSTLRDVRLQGRNNKSGKV